MAPLDGAGPVGKAPADPIQHHGYKGDHNSRQQTLTELCLAHLTQDFPADVCRTTDDRGNDHHAQRRHGGLVNTNHDVRKGARYPNPPE